MNDRTCIVTRRAGDADELIRFVLGPDGAVVPDLKRKLPGRGCWVTASRGHVEKAAKKNLFARSLRQPALVPDDLAGLVDRLLVRDALGAMGLARKAGAVVTGATKADAAVRGGDAVALVHAVEASPDGVRKLSQARRALAAVGGPSIPAFDLFPESEMGLALGGTNVIHAAVLAGEPGGMVLKRLEALARYRGRDPEDRLDDAEGDAVVEAAEDME